MYVFLIRRCISETILNFVVQIDENKNSFFVFEIVFEKVVIDIV